MGERTRNCPKCGVELPHTHGEAAVCADWYPDLTDEWVSSVAEDPEGVSRRASAHTYLRMLAAEVLRLRATTPTPPAQKPRLTAKALEGLALMAGQVEAGGYLDEGGEMEDEATTVRAACRWIRGMQRHRATPTPEAPNDG